MEVPITGSLARDPRQRQYVRLPTPVRNDRTCGDVCQWSGPSAETEGRLF
jgi:hypothetical protein